jgi:pentapeptide repeat protein
MQHTAARRSTIAKWSAATSIALLVLVLVVLLIGPVAVAVGGDDLRHLDPKARLDALNSIRQVLLSAAAGATGFAVIVVTLRTYVMNRRGQLSGRFSTAITQLSSDKLDERTGAIYSLQNILRESPADHEKVIQLLAAFVRANSTTKTLKPTEGRLGTGPPRPHRLRTPLSGGPAEVKEDIQVAMTVLATRPARAEKFTLRLDGADLRGIDLTGGRLAGASLLNANLDRAQLTDVDFTDAHLDCSTFTQADLTRATFSECFACSADFTNAHIVSGKFHDAMLVGANFSDAKLVNADFSRSVLHLTVFDGADTRKAKIPAKDTRTLEAEERLAAALRHGYTFDEILGEGLLDLEVYGFPAPRTI